MSILQLFIIAFAMPSLLSCSSRRYRLSDTDFDWVSYKGRDTLVFSSNTGDTDTLFIRPGKRFMQSGDPLDGTPDSTEHFYIPYKFSYVDTTNGMKINQEEALIAMHKTENNHTNIGFGVVTNDALFYGLKYFDIKKLNNIKLATLQTDLKTYNDIFTVEPDTSNDKYAARDHYVLKMYWSKSTGLVRYDKTNNVHYTLTKKYGL